MVAFLFLSESMNAQTVTFAAKAYVDGDEEEIDEDDQVSYASEAEVKALAGSSISPPLVGAVEVRVTWKLSGSDSTGATYNLSSEVSTTLTAGGDGLDVAALHKSNDKAEGTWTYSYLAEKKVGGIWVPITGGSMSIVFKDTGGGGGGGMGTTGN